MSRSEMASLITAARKRAGYETIYAFCKKTGLSTGLISGIERGINSPSLDTLEKIFDAIGWDVVLKFRRRK